MWDHCLNGCVYISHTSRAVWTSAKVPSVSSTQPRMSLLKLHKSPAQRGHPNYQAGGRHRHAVHKQIYLDGGAWSKERDTVCRLRGREGEGEKKNYLPDTRQSQSPRSIACFFHTPNPRRRHISSAGVSMHASGAPGL